MNRKKIIINNENIDWFEWGRIWGIKNLLVKWQKVCGSLSFCPSSRIIRGLYCCTPSFLVWEHVMASIDFPLPASRFSLTACRSSRLRHQVVMPASVSGSSPAGFFPSPSNLSSFQRDLPPTGLPSPIIYHFSSLSLSLSYGVLAEALWGTHLRDSGRLWGRVWEQAVLLERSSPPFPCRRRLIEGETTFFSFFFFSSLVDSLSDNWVFFFYFIRLETFSKDCLPYQTNRWTTLSFVNPIKKVNFMAIMVLMVIHYIAYSVFGELVFS